MWTSLGGHRSAYHAGTDYTLGELKRKTGTWTWQGVGGRRQRFLWGSAVPLQGKGDEARPWGSSLPDLSPLPSPAQLRRPLNSRGEIKKAGGAVLLKQVPVYPQAVWFYAGNTGIHRSC